MNILFGNKIILEPILNIIRQIKYESNNYYFKDIYDKGDYLRVTCPYHKDGHEMHPSCSIYQRTDNNDIVAGTLHCFTCGMKVQLYSVVSYCLNLNDDELGKEWLIQRFGQLISMSKIDLPELVINNTGPEYLDESELNKYEYNNSEALDYLINKRHLNLEVIRKFKVGYNPVNRCITFPTWSSNNRLVGVFQRSIDNKNFIIPQNIQKPIYLLNNAINNNYTKVYVVESQINALTLYGWGRPAIALFGTGTRSQYNELNKSGIRHFILCLDGDEAGFKGSGRFIQNMYDDILVDYIQIPKNKDVNDLTLDEFINLEEKYL